jgi:hypothetical protein
MAALVLAIVAPRLAGVEHLAETTRSQVIPKMVVQHKQAVWTESLRSSADLVVHTPDATVRKGALVKAEQLVSALLQGADDDRRTVLTQAIGGLRLAAAAADTADRLDRESRAMLAAAEGRIVEIRTALTSIDEDPAGALLQRPGGTRRPQTAPALAATSQDLLARLDEGRILLASAASMKEPEGLRAAAQRFGSIGEQLQAGLNGRHFGPDEVHLPGMLKDFIALKAIFEHRQGILAAQDQALVAGRLTKMQLAHLREALAANAAGAAEASIATIADHIRGIRNVALATLGAGVAVATGITLYGQGAAPVPPRPASEEAARPQQGWRQEHLARSGELARRYHKAHRNLDHWRDTLSCKLGQTIAAVLTGCSPDHEDPELEAPFAAASEVQAPASGDAGALPDPVPELIQGIREQLLTLTGNAADLGMAALGDCIAAASGEPAASPPDGDDEPRAALLRLEAVARTVEQVVVQIGLCLGDINALAATIGGQASSPGTPARVEPIVHRLQGLFEDLVIAREHLEAADRAPA